MSPKDPRVWQAWNHPEWIYASLPNNVWGTEWKKNNPHVSVRYALYLKFGLLFQEIRDWVVAPQPPTPSETNEKLGFYIFFIQTLGLNWCRPRFELVEVDDPSSFQCHFLLLHNVPRPLHIVRFCQFSLILLGRYIKVQDSSPKNYWEGNCSYIYLSTKTKTNVSHVVLGLLQTDRPVTL